MDLMWRSTSLPTVFDIRANGGAFEAVIIDLLCIQLGFRNAACKLLFLLVSNQLAWLERLVQ
jgi:hypothetical protein